jgi:hypothetical protein
MTGATTVLQPLRSFEPPLRLSFDHFRNPKGELRAVAEMPGSGPTWLSGFRSLRDRTGAERLVATYVKITPPLEAYEAGLCVWSEATARFEQHQVLWRKSDEHPKAPPLLDGHAVSWRDGAGEEWVLFGDPLPRLRCRASFEAWQDPAQWERLEPQKSIPADDSDRMVKPHSGSIAWNDSRERWVTVFMESFGEPSTFGEVWYAEADQPTGPWGPAVKVLTHDNYTFYNPRLHLEFTPEDSRILLFEGTYTAQFTRDASPTARYDYNQMLYRLDLDDPALAPAQRAPAP